MSLERSKINRLIIVGNGFDLNLGLPTSYKDFISGLIEYIIDNRNFYDRYPSTLFDIEGVLREDLKKEDLLNVAKDFFKFKSPLLIEAVEELDKKNWTDLERIYYSELTRIYDAMSKKSDNDQTKDFLSKVEKLNKELKEIAILLSLYLTKVIQKNKDKIASVDNFYEKFAKPFDCKDFDDATLRKNESEIKDKIPSRILILNFNYTQLFTRDFKLASWNDLDQDFTILNIHGKMDDPNSMVFGYGDEFDERYNKIEALGEDEWLRNFKSFKYFKTKDYDKLLGFIELDDYQTWIVGHSCGLSDKTMLKHIFEHDKCINIKAFYHEKTVEDKNIDNFDEICFSISRLMKDKPRMRQLVTKKHDGCNFNSI
jgi:hypothetical protein